jgi:hypothetical protein
MAVTSKLERAQWQPYLERISAQLEGEQVEIDAASLAMGVQPVARWSPLLGLQYDDKDKLVSVMAEGLDHMIRHPGELYVQTSGVDLLSLEVIEDDGTRHLVSFRKPLLLPPAGS